MTEAWKIITDYPNYEVSSLGRVRHVELKIIKQLQIHNNGYYRVKLYKNKPKRAVKIMVHSLVARAFLGDQPMDLHVNHKDGNKLNNNVNNLEYITTQENIKHAWRLGLHSGYGSSHFNAKLTEDDVINIRELLNIGVNKKIIAKDYNITVDNIRYIEKRLTWKHI